jgi:AAA15 family ATPase/GTPase
MLLRFFIKNLYSFDNQKDTEFNMLPARISRLGHHKYKMMGKEILKMAALYGANGAGKSNLVNAILLLKYLVVEGKIHSQLANERFKLSIDSSNDPICIGIEFIASRNLPFLYQIKIKDSSIIEEELYQSGLGSEDDFLLFSRKTDGDISTIEFFDDFTRDNLENQALKNVIEKTLIKPELSTLNLLNSLKNEKLSLIKEAFLWFSRSLEVITPDVKPIALPQKLDREPNFKKFAVDLICSFSTGVSNLFVEKKTIGEFLGKDNKQIDEIETQLKNSPDRISILGPNIIGVYEEGKVITKQVYLEHPNDKQELVKFNLSEESDGTIRLLEYIPAIQEIIEYDKVYIIDEIERSIHPLTIKEIISKFSLDETTKGQLIFTTHESNLLDQDILRLDEIWFVQKSDKGSTEIYPLSEFKEHHTIDIRKGYLNGRYGAIPFLSNLHDLNWKENASVE